MLISPLLAILPLVASASASTSNCHSGLHIIVARGTSQSPTGSLTEQLAQKAADRVGDGSEVVELDYPATFASPDYEESESEGAEGLRRMAEEYAGDCAEGRMALVGYSQGAQVVMDVVCGGIPSFNNVEAVSSDLIGKNIIAVALMGDPSHIANLTYNRGTSTRNGIFPRKETCTHYDTVIASWCDTGDIFCDSGTSLSVHNEYQETYADDIVEFIAGRYDDAGSEGEGSRSASSMTTGIGTSSGAVAMATSEAGDGPTATEGGGVTSTGDNRAIETSDVAGTGVGLGFESWSLLGLAAMAMAAVVV